MGSREFRIDPDIRRARTLPAEVYRDPHWYELQRERVFARYWQALPDGRALAQPGEARPFMLLPGCLDEPLVLTRDESAQLHCLSNVCTHRGNLVVEQPGTLASLRCRYHGRRFGLDGRFVSMPGFEGVHGFPGEQDDLRPVPAVAWGPLLFVGLEPAVHFEEWLGPVRRRMDWMPLDELRFDAGGSREYEIEANWALYCDNYLEGFHIPFVHPGLARAFDHGGYQSETFSWSNLQVGIAREGDPCFEPPVSHPDHGRRVAAYYFWLFPATMLNFYPWGLSLNVVQPLAVDRTRVAFVSYVLDPSLRERGAGADLHRVEMEDEAVVEAVQRGVRSRLYDRGRYSPAREVCVHHFHRLLETTLRVG